PPGVLSSRSASLRFSILVCSMSAFSLVLRPGNLPPIFASSRNSSGVLSLFLLFLRGIKHFLMSVKNSCHSKTNFTFCGETIGWQVRFVLFILHRKLPSWLLLLPHF